MVWFRELFQLRDDFFVVAPNHEKILRREKFRDDFFCGFCPHTFFCFTDLTCLARSNFQGAVLLSIFFARVSCRSFVDLETIENDDFSVQTRPTSLVGLRGPETAEKKARLTLGILATISSWCIGKFPTMRHHLLPFFF